MSHQSAVQHPLSNFRADQVRQRGTFPLEKFWVVSRHVSAVTKFIELRVLIENDINIVNLPNQLFGLLLPLRLRNILEFGLHRIRNIAPAKAHHRVSVDHKSIHLKYRAGDPIEGALSNLFNIGRKTAGRHSNPIEEQLLKTIKE